jgi:hypothetical protein
MSQSALPTTVTTGAPLIVSFLVDWTHRGEQIWIADAHRRDGKRFVVRVDQKLTAFLELQRAIHEFAVSLIS